MSLLHRIITYLWQAKHRKLHFSFAGWRLIKVIQYPKQIRSEENMSSQINDLVAIRDIDSLYEIMSEDEEWMNQMDAAEGLVKLGDRRGYEFLLTATLSDDEEILEVAKEILDSPELKKMQREVEAERASQHRAHIESARKRLQKGGKVYR